MSESSITQKHRRKVWITSSDVASKVCDLLPSNEGRQSLVSSLIQAYRLDCKCENVIPIYKAKTSDLEAYHDKRFLKCLLRKRSDIDSSSPHYGLLRHILRAQDLQQVFRTKAVLQQSNIEHNLNVEGDHREDSDCGEEIQEIGDLRNEEQVYSDDEDVDDQEECDKYGLLFDCPVFPFMADYVRFTAASSILSAEKLVKERSIDVQNVVINWYGGRHHCMKSKAAGFCYVNDVILAISHLRREFGKVFYLDFDLHHGDGVENGYKFSRNVMTCSIHRFDLGFYPGTGSHEFFLPTAINIPTRRGLSDSSLLYITKETILPLIKSFSPGVIVIQAGCDGLGTDDHRQWNMTIRGYSKVIQLVIDEFSPAPVMILGGGGYNFTETAKCWAFITKEVIGIKEEWDLIPEHELLDEYEIDGFQFWTANNTRKKNIKDENDDIYLQKLTTYINERYL
ncbi:uncharacterized protein PRCAT00003950001 [Priceomyces carsonii]|uniref:uncharacterized protein n=1 Tax=Priceomyces carsonii TaxID=28549 RepID=UPI002ED82FFD|nr:unnamed protein product [Priceomyces carsonii]